MKNEKSNNDRRDFLKAAGLTSLSFMMPGAAVTAMNASLSPGIPGKKGKFEHINFSSDGLSYTPEEYLEVLLEMNQTQGIQRDFYSAGGAPQKLEETFADVTGKEKAVFLPTGTMANQLALKLLSKEKAKVIVPENSHIFRDEADAAQSVHNKRLVPVGKGSPYYDLQMLEQTIDYYRSAEVFKSGVGAVAIESPVRRANGTAVPLEKIQAITSYCKEKGYKTHLDGARIHIASAYTGVSVKEYSSSFDTVYVSLYKYLNAAYGGILCGDAEFIDHIPHEAKILGGSTFQNWVSAAMALHHLLSTTEDWKNARNTGDRLITKLNAIKGMMLSPVPQGTNIYKLELDQGIDFSALQKTLIEDHSIGLRNQEADGTNNFYINASVLRRPVEDIAGAFEESLLKL